MASTSTTRRSSGTLRDQAHQVAMNMLRPISRKYDRAEHAYPKELDMLAAMIDGLSESGAGDGRGRRRRTTRRGRRSRRPACRNGANLASVMSIAEMCWGDVGLLLSMPRQGLGNSAIASVADDEQQERFDGTWAAMAITEPGAGSDSASIRTTAVLDGDDYVLNGEKIYVTSGERADSVVVWATLDKSLGRAAIKSFVVEKGTPGMAVERLEHKLGIRASDTAAITFTDCRVPKENLLGSPDVDAKQGFAGAMATFDNTRPLVAAMAVGVARAVARPDPRPAGRGRRRGRPRPAGAAAARGRGRAPAARGRLGGRPPAHAAGGLAGRQPDSPTRWRPRWPRRRPAGSAPTITLSCVELCGTLGYSEAELLEKWSRDSKILDIFEGTQQIQQLIVARRVLGLSQRRAEVGPARSRGVQETALKGSCSARMLLDARLVEAGVDGLVLLGVADALGEGEGRGRQVDGAEPEERADPRVVGR